jgi:hypothetical protein
MGLMKIMTKKETWNYVVVGWDSTGPKFLGITESYEGATSLQQTRAMQGWANVAVFDATLREVKEKPKAGSA